jgi:ribose transport system ATP-binding protein
MKYFKLQIATILRDGQVVGAVAVRDTDKSEIISMMTGRQVFKTEAKTGANTGGDGTELLRAEHIGDGKLIRDLSFSLYENERFWYRGIGGSGTH